MLEGLLRVLHRHQVAQDAGHVVLAGHRGHDLFVQVPHDSREITEIHVGHRIAIVTLRAVHVEGHALAVPLEQENVATQCVSLSVCYTLKGILVLIRAFQKLPNLVSQSSREPFTVSTQLRAAYRLLRDLTPLLVVLDHVRRANAMAVHVHLNVLVSIWRH